MIATLLSTSVFALLAAQTAAVPTPVAVTVPRWSSYDMTLTATGHYDSPYVSVDLLGVFSGPDGKAVVVRGFWDGGQTFRVRFTPTIEGTWTFTTVSDDAGLDAHGGTITCVGPKDGAHGFVRQPDRMSGGRPVYDDDSAVTSGSASAVGGNAIGGNATMVSVRASAARCGGVGDSCADPIGPGRDYVSVAVLQAADARVTEALAAGRLAEVSLFDASEAAKTDEPRMYRYLEYMTARYAAFPNVVWCMHPAAPDDGQQAFWRTARSLATTLDPYSRNAARERLLLDECTSASAAPAASSVSRQP